MNTEPREVRITRRINASPERVFDAWLNPQILGRWMFGPGACTEGIVQVTLDPRPGGSFSYVQRRGGKELHYVGVYREIDRPRRIVYSWGEKSCSPEETALSVDFVPDGTGCELRLVQTFVPKTDDFATIIEGSWHSMLNALEIELR